MYMARKNECGPDGRAKVSMPSVRTARKALEINVPLVQFVPQRFMQRNESSFRSTVVG